MKTLKDLDLKPKDKEKVTEMLQGWLDHYVKKADGRKGTIERVDMEELDYFFFTDCSDILADEPESMGKESNEKIIKRKEFVRAQLFIRHLLDEKLGRPRACSHCGNDYRWINTLGDGTGHYVYCAKCHLTTIVTYPAGYFTCTKRLVEDLRAHGYPEHPAVTKVLNIIKKQTEEQKRNAPKKCDTCKRMFGPQEFTYCVGQCNDCYHKECQ